MSVNPIQSYINTLSPFFQLVNASTIKATSIVADSVQANIVSTGAIIVDDIDINGEVFVSTLNATGKLVANELSSITLYTDVGAVSTLFTQHIILDQATLDVINGNELLLNGIPIATTSNISSVGDWAYFGAVSTVNMNGYDIINCGNLKSQNIYNSLAVQSDSINATTLLTATTGNITTLRATNFSTLGNATVVGNLTTSNLLASNITANAGFYNSISTGSINGTPIAPTSNWSQFPATSAVNMNGYNLVGGSNLQIQTSNLTLVASNALSNTCRDFTVVADEGINIASVANINLTAQNGTYGAVNITANGGFSNAVNGVVNITANGSQVGGVGQGGSVNITANTPLGFSNLTSKISLNASGINSYAGVVPPVASIAGYNFIYGTGGVNICAGLPAGALPNTVGTTYIYGTTGVEIPSQAYMKGIEPYFDGINTPPDLQITGRYIAPNFADVRVRLSNVRYEYFDSNTQALIQDVKTINFASAGGAITNLTTINGAAYPPPTSGVLPAQLVSTVGGLGTAGYISTVGPALNNISTLYSGSGSNLIISSLNGGKVSINSFSTIKGGSTVPSVYGRALEYFYNPPTPVGGAEIAVKGKAQNAGAIITASMGTDVATGTSYIQSVWDGNISMPLSLYAANFNFQSDTDYILFLDGQAGSPATLSTGFTFYMASTITQKNQNLIANTRQPFIQYGRIATSGANGNQLTTLSTTYANTSYVVAPLMNDATPANFSYVINSRSTFTTYWANAGTGAHSISFSAFGDI